MAAQAVGQQFQPVALARQPLGEEEQRRPRRQHRAQHFPGPCHAKGVDAHDHQISVLDHLAQAVIGVGRHRVAQPRLDARVDACFVDLFDDVAVEMSAHEAHPVPIVGQRHGERAAHHPRAENDDIGHDWSPLAIAF
jgi:hypothetical protein